jgi:hypothetical protein
MMVITVWYIQGYLCNNFNTWGSRSCIVLWVCCRCALIFIIHCWQGNSNLTKRTIDSGSLSAAHVGTMNAMVLASSTCLTKFIDWGCAICRSDGVSTRSVVKSRSDSRGYSHPARFVGILNSALALSILGWKGCLTFGRLIDEHVLSISLPNA